MILVGQYDSPYVRRVAISLKLAGLQFTRDTRSVFADADEMRRINPLGRIPSLVLDDGEVLIDSGAILDYLDEMLGSERALLPARHRLAGQRTRGRLEAPAEQRIFPGDDPVHGEDRPAGDQRRHLRHARAGLGKGRIRRRTSRSRPVIRRPTLPGRDSAQL